jgi:photosystem II stability/assembly factor-like uncharacterized protein
MRAIAAKLVASILFGVLASSAQLASDIQSTRVDASNGTPSIQPVAWRSVGPAPPAIGAAIAAHAPSDTIYIGSEGGNLLKSTDGGATFVAVDNGLFGSQVLSMVMDPNDPNVVYAGGFKTTDGGATWIDLGGHGAGFVLAMDPTNPNIVYSGLSGVEKTIDGGMTWESVSNGLGDAQIFSFAINPFNPNVLFAGTTGDGAFKSIDGAATWTAIDIDSTVYGLLVDPDDGNIVYAGSNGNGVYKSTDGGDSFARVGSPQMGVVFSIVKSGNRLYAGTAGGGVSVSEDGGVTWRNTGVSQSQGLILSVDSAGAVYVGTNFDGTFVLPAGDHNPKWRRLAWKELKACACQLGHGLSIDPADHNHVFFTTNDGGLLVTNDGGAHWQDGGTDGFVARTPRAVGFDPQQPWRVYASSVAGGLFKSEDHGKHWQRRRFGSSTNYTTGISVDPVDHSVYVATLGNLGIDTNGIWKSTDFGETFTRIDRAPHALPDDFLDLSGRGITVDPHHHDTVYFADRSSGIWRSRNAGASWYRVDATPAFSVTVDPTDSNIVYAGTTGSGVLKSTDAGSSFRKKSHGLPKDATTARTGSVLVNPKDHNVLYVGIEGEGVFKSTDGARTWSPINSGLDDLGVFGLAMDPEFPDILYASTFSSVYKITRAGL